jgi:hypothetical protein
MPSLPTETSEQLGSILRKLLENDMCYDLETFGGDSFVVFHTVESAVHWALQLLKEFRRRNVNKSWRGYGPFPPSSLPSFVSL